MIVLHRIVLPALNALLITLALIYCMFLLIKSDSLELSEPKSNRHLDWVHVPEDPEVIVKSTRTTKPKEVLLAPVIQRVAPVFNNESENLVSIPVAEIEFDTPEITVYEPNQLTLAFAYPAEYPLSKLNRGVEGFVSIGFSVSPVGEVYDAFVIEAEPKGAFEKSALKAIEKFKYKPRYENGRAVSTSGQSYVFRYEITKEQ